MNISNERKVNPRQSKQLKGANESKKWGEQQQKKTFKSHSFVSVLPIEGETELINFEIQKPLNETLNYLDTL